MKTKKSTDKFLLFYSFRRSKIKVYLSLTFFIFFLFAYNSVTAEKRKEDHSQTSSKKTESLSLKNKIEALERKYFSRIGVAIFDRKTRKKIFSWRETEPFKMSSTVKLPLAVFLLHEAQQGNINMNALASIEPYHMLPASGKIQYFATYSGLKISYRNLLQPMLIISESVAADILFEKTGGPAALHNFLKLNGYSGFSIDRNFAQLFIDSRGYKTIPEPKKRTLDWWNLTYQTLKKDSSHRIDMSHKFHAETKDTVTPGDMAWFLLSLDNGTILNASNFKHLYKMLSKCETGDRRIKKNIKKTGHVANKTGTWNTALYEYMADVGFLSSSRAKLVYAVYIETILPENWKKGLYSEVIFPVLGEAIAEKYLVSD